MATTDTLPPFTQGYTPHSAEPNKYQIFYANAEREAEEAGVLELLQQRSSTRRDHNGKQRKSNEVMDMIIKPLQKCSQRPPGHHSRYDIDEESFQALFSLVIEDQWDTSVLEDVKENFGTCEPIWKREEERQRNEAL